MAITKLSSDTKLKVWSSTINALIDSKVDVVAGKGLSTVDFTSAYENKLKSIASSAEVNQNAFSNITVGSTTVAADTKTDTVTFTAGTGISISADATADSVTFTNAGVTAVSSKSNGVLSVTTNGTAADVTAYTHPTATAASAGLYKVTVNSLGHVTATTAVVKADITGLGIPTSDTTYSAATTTADGLMTSAMVTKLNSIAESANKYSLPNATTSTLGGVKVGSNIGVNAGVISVPNATSAVAGVMKLYSGSGSATDGTVTQAGIVSLVDAAIGSKIDAANAMRYMGTLGTGGTITALPTTYNAGDTYLIKTAGTYAGQKCEVGDMIIAITDQTTAVSSTVNADWSVLQKNYDGIVTGPTSAVANRIATFTDTSGKVIKDSGYTIATSVPSGAVFTDHITSATTSGSGNAVTAVTADANGQLTVTKGTTFLVASDISDKADKATTLAGYGITDAKIVSGVITLGSNTITPLVAASTLDASKLSGTASVNTTGNAATATKLASAVNINGTAFDGSSAITTSKWGTARTITIADNTSVYTQANSSIDGSANFTLKLPATITASLAGTADRAIADEDGNNIKSTYARISDTISNAATSITSGNAATITALSENATIITVTTAAYTLAFTASSTATDFAVKYIHLTNSVATTLTVTGAVWAFNGAAPVWGKNANKHLLIKATFVAGRVVLDVLDNDDQTLDLATELGEYTITDLVASLS